LISHQQAIAENWDLPNTEIFQFKDIASGLKPASNAYFWTMEISKNHQKSRKLCISAYAADSKLFFMLEPVTKLNEKKLDPNKERIFFDPKHCITYAKDTASANRNS
jgi:hypothetical protein